MVARKLTRVAFLGLICFLVATIYYIQAPTSSLSEDGNPEAERDANGNTKTPDLAPGVGQVIDTHRIATQDPFDFPKKLHQTAQRDTATAARLSWFYANPGEEHTFYNDKAAKTFVQKYAEGPVASLYDHLADPVARADLFRYIVLRYAGGVYADIDTTTLCPMNAWIPSEFKSSDIKLVIGIEVDEPTITEPAKIDKWGWAANFQFVQWVMMAKPGHKALDIVISEVVKRVEALAKEKGVKVAELRMTGHEIIKTTGPGAFTTGILKYLKLDDPIKLRGLTRPHLEKDILVMPVSSFAPNQRHSKSKSVKYVENIPEVLVMHGFQATRTWADSLKDWAIMAAARARVKAEEYTH